MVPGLSSAVMASMLGGPPSTPATSGPRSTPMSVNGRAPTATPLGAGRQRVQAASEVHGTLYYLFHPSQGAGPGYGYYLTNPSQMDRDLRYGFYGAVAVAGVAGGVATGGMIYYGPAAACPTFAGALGVGGAAAAGANAPAVVATGGLVAQWLGPRFQILINNANAFVARSADGSRQFRIDWLQRNTVPHAHLQVFDPVLRKFIDAPGSPHQLPFLP